MASAKPQSDRKSKSSNFMDGVDRKPRWQQITMPVATASEHVDVSKTNVEMLSSYNWIRSKDGVSAIAVPGEPCE